ncbi:MAG: 2-aminobenzoate-CoA ligase [Gammaproteobacteria bacterium]|nr:2-aminobenzoate-CoA ligase [Gammaproteobacteria bacterium]
MLHIFISAPGEAIQPGATGKPVPGYVAELFDDQLQPIHGTGQEGWACAAPLAVSICLTAGSAISSRTAGI